MLRQKRILVADDAATSRLIAAKLLRELGYEVITARDGVEVLAEITRGDVALVLLDVMMPDLDKYETLKELRRRYTKEQLPVVMLTASADTDAASKIAHAGANAFLVKPVSKAALYESLTICLGKLGT